MDQNPVPVPAATVVYTDGACSPNPGPGGWAWAVPRGRYASGARARTTNQRMELMAVLEAAKALDGPLEVVSDSTYVINCFRDRWWEGWLQRDWTNSRKRPVVNRDLWEPLIAIVRQRGLTFRWVKGHSGDPMNELVDRLAGEAGRTQQGRQGVAPELGHTKLRRNGVFRMAKWTTMTATMRRTTYGRAMPTPCGDSPSSPAERYDSLAT